MSKKSGEENVSELKKIRLESEVSAKDIAEDMGISLSHYIMKESGARKSKNEEDNEKFFFDACHSITKLQKIYGERASSIEYNIQEETDKLKGMYHATITPEIYKKVIKRLQKRENLIVVCTDYLINYEKIEKMLREDGLEQYTLDGIVEEKDTMTELLMTETNIRNKFYIEEELDIMSV